MYRLPSPADISDINLSAERGWELSHLRKKCRDLDIEDCYNRYIDRLAVTNTALFLLIMELILFIQAILLSFVFKASMFFIVPYLILMILLPLILFVCFKEISDIKRARRFNILASCVAVIVITVMDTYVTFLLSVDIAYVLSSYDYILTVSIYFLLPIGLYGRPYLLAMVIAIMHIIYEFIIVTDQVDHEVYDYINSIITINILMVAFHYGMEYHLRCKVLNRRKLLHQNYLLESAMRKEQLMIQTILSPEIAETLQEEIRTRIEEEMQGKDHFTQRILFVEFHSSVTILVADMVNYTYLTTQLSCKDLVRILHRLFVKYDLAAERNNVLRIKFLGDAYNCVSGMPHPNVFHAKSCVDLALEMINETQIMSKQLKLKIDLRIGVHSGEVYSGIIGHNKWQYDVWSRDVDVANRLENFGKPGKVHISQTTLNLLDDEYPLEESTELTKNDPIFSRPDVRTYLITPMQEDRASLMTGMSTTSSSESFTLDNDEIDEKEINIQIRIQMVENIEIMPVGRIHLAQIFDFSRLNTDNNEDTIFQSRISLFWRLFRNSDMEWSYMNQPDILIKYSLLMVLVVSVGEIISNIVGPFEKHWMVLSILFSSLIIICFTAFYKKIWIFFNPINGSRPRFLLSRWLFKLSELYEEQLIARLVISFTSIFIAYVMGAINVTKCNPYEFQLHVIQSQLSDSYMTKECFGPWDITQTVLLMLTLLQLFFGVPLIFKAGLCVFITASFIQNLYTYNFVWQQALTTNLGFPADYGVLWHVLQFCLLLLIKEQHLLYINKADYHSKVRYLQKLQQTQNSKQSIRIILANMLPSHVVDTFLVRGNTEDLFYENYSNVAVMFATIENFDEEALGLGVLNEYICSFDELLDEYIGYFFKVEKIKVIGWTYMAACGLIPENVTDFSKSSAILRTRRKSTLYSLKNSKSVSLDELSRNRSQFHPRFDHPDLKNDDTCVLTMIQFAVDMLQIMRDISNKNYNSFYGRQFLGRLRIGISHGPVMAGVVGFSRPHYDIWGHTVNMASRMASTGQYNFIHVTEDTAFLLRKFDIKCTYRGQTKVKGIGDMPTYFVALDEDLNFEYIDDVDLDAIQILDVEETQAKEIIYLKMSESKTDNEQRETNEKGTQTARKRKPDTDT